jgi:hypothetical protein
MRIVPAIILVLAICGACGEGVDTASDPLPENPLYVDPMSRDFYQNSELLDRVLASHHGCLRLINIPFSQEVCRRLGDSLSGTPSFNLHGDAHLEQYAVTDLGRGLTDFDDSSTGPAIVDLMRFGVSLHLACDARGWSDEAEAIYGEFLRGYRLGLDKPEAEVGLPTVARRLRSGFEYDRGKYFHWVDSIMESVPEEEKAELLRAIEPYVDAMLAENPDLDRDYFQVVEVGYLRLGIGSALDRKYLIRIRGESDLPADDLLLELKQVRDLTGIDCISVARGTDPFRILIGQSRIAYQPYRLLGYVRFRDWTFWVHAWVDNYEEAQIEETFLSPDELAEVAFDIGVQLGRGHPNQIASPLDLQLRREQLRLLDRDEETLKRTAREMAVQVTEAWETFRSHNPTP